MSLSGWNAGKKIKLTIPVQSSALTNFPVLVNLSGSSGTGNFDCAAVFTDLGANSKKIAVEIGDTGVQCYCEIERWDNANSSAWLWVKVPSVSASAATVLYLYYDSAHADNTAYVGDIGSTPGQNVWDGNFTAVYHMSQDPSGGANSIKDSTSNANHGSPVDTMYSSQLVDGLISKGISLNGANNGIGTGINSLTDPYTIEMVFVPANTNRGVLWGNFAGSAQDFCIEWDSSTILAWDDTPAGGNTQSSTLTTAVHNFAYKVSAAGTTLLIVDGSQDGTTSDNQGTLNSGSAYQIGNRPSDNDFGYEGVVDEVRISDVDRSNDWLTATNLSNTDALITYGTPAADTVIDRYIPPFPGFPTPRNTGFLPGLSPSGLIRQNRKGFSKAF